IGANEIAEVLQVVQGLDPVNRDFLSCDLVNEPLQLNLSLTPQHSKCRLQFLNRLLCFRGLVELLLCDLNPEVPGTNQVLCRLERGMRTRLDVDVGLNRELERLTPGVVRSSVVLGQNLSGLCPVDYRGKQLLQLPDWTPSRFGAG